MESRFRSRRCRIVRGAWVAAAAALGACGGGAFDAYRSAHPGWQPALPDAPGGVEEVVAALHAPDAVPGIRVELVEVEILDVAAEPWRALPSSSLRERSAVARESSAYAVIVQRRCRATAELEAHEALRVDSYLILDGRVESYSHSEFGARCATRDRFRAARGDRAALERAVNERVQKRYGRRPLQLAELYQRGLAYVEAGRIAEAQALLGLADPGYRAAQRERRPTGAAAGSLGEIERLRANLLRALGLQARDP